MSRVAIVGGGTAGLAAAALLHDDGHAVELFERFASPSPVGAGLLLQPTGLAVLDALGLKDGVVARGSRVDRLAGETAGGRRVLDLAYADWRAGAHGVGVHRHILFDALWTAVAARRGIAVHTGVDVQQPPEGFDLVVGCDGARSTLRGDGRAFARRRMRPYPWGALWAIVDDPDERYAGVLHQTYRGTREMVGTLPSGRPDDGPPRVSVFISVAADARASVRLDALKRRVASLCGRRLDPILDQLDDPDQLLWAGYHDVVLGRLHHGRTALAGDAAHAMSPQLGQGANLALVDALGPRRLPARAAGRRLRARRLQRSPPRAPALLRVGEPAAHARVPVAARRPRPAARSPRSAAGPRPVRARPDAGRARRRAHGAAQRARRRRPSFAGSCLTPSASAAWPGPGGRAGR